MSATYAKRTEVSSAKSRAEIEKTLTRYGATSFAYGWEEQHAAIGFKVDGRQIRFVLPMPDRSGREFTHTPTGLKRTPSSVEAVYDQAVRQRWRALALVVKAKLEAVASGIVTLEQEFYAQIVLPNGRTVYEETQSAVEQAYATGRVAPLLQIEGGAKS